jgi:hypothetical protein
MPTRVVVKGHPANEDCRTGHCPGIVLWRDLVSVEGLGTCPPPGTPKSGEFRKNGTIRKFSSPLRAPSGFLTPVIKIRANRRYWTGDLFLNGLWWAEMKGRPVLGIGLTSVRGFPMSAGFCVLGHLCAGERTRGGLREIFNYCPENFFQLCSGRSGSQFQSR